MEMFGSAFDDSMFAEVRDKVTVALSPYKAKFCEPQWFCESAALDTEDSLEKQKVFKFRGDLALRQGSYQNALEAYSSCLEWIPENNLSIRRDVLEGMARSYTQLGERERALETADLLSKESSNTCHLINLLLLKVSIHQKFGPIGSKMASLEQLCSLLPFNPWHWYNLGQSCLQRMEADKPLRSCAPLLRGSEAEQKDGWTEESGGEMEDRTWLKACMCLVRTRLLLMALKQQQSSFVLQRSENALRWLDKALQRLNPPEGALCSLTEVMSEDLEKMREENQDGESLAGLCVQSFAERWWNKVLLTPQAHGPQKQPEKL